MLRGGPLGEFHGFGVPVDDVAAFDAEIAEEGRTSGAEAEGCVLNDGLAAADGVEEVVEVIVAVGVAGRRDEFLDFLRRRPAGVLDGIFFAVLFDVLPLHGVGEGGNGVAGLGCKRSAGDGDGVAGNLHEPFRACEKEALAFLAAVDKVDAKAEIEALRIVEEREQNVIYVAAVLPEAQTARGHGARGAICAGDEVGAAEEVHEEVASDAGTVVLPFAPLEETLAREWDVWR